MKTDKRVENIINELREDIQKCPQCKQWKNKTYNFKKKKNGKLNKTCEECLHKAFHKRNDWNRS